MAQFVTEIEKGTAVLDASKWSELAHGAALIAGSGVPPTVSRGACGRHSAFELASLATERSGRTLGTTRQRKVGFETCPGTVVRTGFSESVRRTELGADRIIGMATVPGVAIDLSDRQVQGQTCEECGRTYQRVVIFATKDGGAYSVLSAQCHGHTDAQVWLDATLGSWEEPFSDHVTFSCRIAEQGAGLVDALVASKGDAKYYGRRLTREAALEHPALPSLWELVDQAVTTVPELQDSLASDADPDVT